MRIRHIFSSGPRSHDELRKRNWRVIFSKVLTVVAKFLELVICRQGEDKTLEQWNSGGPWRDAHDTGNGDRKFDCA